MDEIKTFDKLPVEVISHIFTFLQFGDRKNASTVCWSWYEASIHPMFLNNEVICLKDMNNDEIMNALITYTKSLRALFSFKICGLGVLYIDFSINHWVETIWPLLATKVFSLEFFDTVVFVDGILPSILNKTQNLKVLKIHNLQYSPKEELYNINRLQSLEELTLDNFETDNIDKCKLIGIIPKKLRTICLKFMWGSELIIEDIKKVLNYCSFYLETLELINIDVTPELMQSIASLGLKLKKFSLVLADPMHYEHKPEMVEPLFETQWPLVDLTLCAQCLTDEHLNSISDTFKNLEKLAVTFVHDDFEITLAGIHTVKSLKKLKKFCIQVGTKTYRLKNEK